MLPFPQDFTVDRPWTNLYWTQNKAHPHKLTYHGVYAQPIRDEDWMWFRGDRVEVIKGKDKGKQGYICQVQSNVRCFGTPQ